MLLNMFCYFFKEAQGKNVRKIDGNVMSDLQHELSEFLIAEERRLPVLPDLTRLGMGCNLC